MRARIKKLLLPLIAAALALACLVCLWRLHALKNLLPDQHAAERWQGEGELDFDQLSFFMARDQKLAQAKVPFATLFGCIPRLFCHLYGVNQRGNLHEVGACASYKSDMMHLIYLNLN